MRRSGGRFTTARAYCTGTTRRRPPRRSPCAYGTLGAEDNGLLIRGSLVRSQLGEPISRGYILGPHRIASPWVAGCKSMFGVRMSRTYA